MVTTRITDAVPITMPNPVSIDRTLFWRSACTLKLRASPIRMGLAAFDFLQELPGFPARRIVRREIVGVEVFLQQLASLSRVSLGVNQAIGARIQNLRRIGRQLFSLLKQLVSFVIMAAPG